MKLIISICTYNRTSSLIRCLESIKKLYIMLNIKIEIIVVDNSIKYSSFKLVKRIKKSIFELTCQYHVLKFYKKKYL